MLERLQARQGDLVADEDRRVQLLSDGRRSSAADNGDERPRPRGAPRDPRVRRGSARARRSTPGRHASSSGTRARSPRGGVLDARAIHRSRPLAVGPRAAADGRDPGGAAAVMRATSCPHRGQGARVHIVTQAPNVMWGTDGSAHVGPAHSVAWPWDGLKVGARREPIAPAWRPRRRQGLALRMDHGASTCPTTFSTRSGIGAWPRRVGNRTNRRCLKEQAIHGRAPQ